MEYSHDSANPVGRLVLWVCGYREESLALALGQGVHGAATGELLAGCGGGRGARAGAMFRPMRCCALEWMKDRLKGECLRRSFARWCRSLVERTREMLLEGGAISKHVDRELAVTLDLFRKGGEAILNGIVARRLRCAARQTEWCRRRESWGC